VALAEAELRDKERDAARRDGKLDQLSWLHGIPISIKEQVSEII
jgi:hypothetical protein